MAERGVIIRLNRIHYLGGNVGRDTNFEFNVNGQITRVGANVRHQTHRQFDRVLLTQEAAEEEFPLSVSVKITEGKEKHQDAGEGSIEYVVKKASGTQVLTPPLGVQVEEYRGSPEKGPTGFFAIQFAAEYLEYGKLGPRYVTSTRKGWITAEATDGGKNFDLPYLIKVEVTRIEDGYDEITVSEGPVGLVGRRGRVRLQHKVSNLSAIEVAREPGIDLVYHKTTRKLEVPGLGEFEVEKPVVDDYPAETTFDIEIPDFPHDHGTPYESRSTYAKSWFRIADPAVPDRYLHTGSYSKGCCTVTEVDNWDNIFRYLINRRLDSRRIGRLKVTEE